MPSLVHSFYPFGFPQDLSAGSLSGGFRKHQSEVGKSDKEGKAVNKGCLIKSAGYHWYCLE